MDKEEIKKAKGWLSSLNINSEYEAISKEIILSHIEQLENKVKELEGENEREYFDLASTIDKVERENTELREREKQLEEIDLTTVYLQGVYDGQDKGKNKIRNIFDVLKQIEESLRRR